MSQTIDQFVVNNDGKLINNGGTQCVAVANQFNRDVVEGGWIGTPVTGYAIDWYDQFGKDPDYANYIQVSASQQGQKGDLAVWRRYPSIGLPHIALVLENRKDDLYCLTQNPGKAHKAALFKTGLAGYLRPKKFIQTVAPSTPAINPVTSDIVMRTMRGDYGNEPQRSVNLRAAGFDPVAVQAAINGQAIAVAQPAVAPASTGFNVGDIVVPTLCVDYNGTSLTQYDPSYTVTEIVGDRAVLSARGQVWAAVRTSNIRKA